MTTSPVNSASSPASDWHLLRIYGTYRILVSISIVGLLLLSQAVPTSTASFRLYTSVAIVYVVICILSQMITRLQTGRAHVQGLIVVFTDLACLAILEHTSPNDSGHLALLQIVAIAAGGILLSGRLAYFLAAMTSLATLYESVIDFWLQDTTTTDWTKAGYTGMTLFATVFFTRQLVGRLRESEELTQRQALNLANLEELNRQIIQRMRTGIIVFQRGGNVKMMNDAARMMFDVTEAGLVKLPDDLKTRIKEWEQDKSTTQRPFREKKSGMEVIASFTALDGSKDSDILIFLEDHTRLSQQAQQLKLASLGSLTASIAHEIRNPLGAASHATQLIAESSDLSMADKRLADIIYKNCLRMNTVIENVLTLSRRSPSKQELLPMNEWVEQFIADYRHTGQTTHRIEFQPDSRVGKIRADSSQMQQVISNLFDNGIRHSMKNSGEGKLLVRTTLNDSTQQPCLDILDWGGGVPEPLAERIFEPFFTSEKTGTGLGLYIARELCEANQARLDYIPEPGGACFRVTFAHPDKQPAPGSTNIRLA